MKVPIPTPLGFHARPATYISIIARHYVDKNLCMIVDEEQFNAKSVMSILQAGGIIADKGSSATVKGSISAPPVVGPRPGKTPKIKPIKVPIIRITNNLTLNRGANI